MQGKMNSIHKNYRLVGLLNSSPEAVLDVKINGTPCSSNSVYIYNFSVPSEQYLYKEISIHIRSGNLKLSDIDAVALYPSYQTESGKVIVVQSNFIEWFNSKTHELDRTYTQGETITFKHLVPQGPNYFDNDGKPVYEYEPLIYLNRDHKTENSKFVKEIILD